MLVFLFLITLIWAFIKYTLSQISEWICTLSRIYTNSYAKEYRERTLSAVLRFKWCQSLGSVFTEPSRIRKLIVCSFHQAPVEVSISIVTPISCRGLWKLMSKPLCPSSLWDRTAKVLRGIDLKDLSSAVCFFFFFFFSAFAFLLLWHSCQRKGLCRRTCLTANSLITPVFGTLQKPWAHCCYGWDLTHKNSRWPATYF